MAKKSFIFCLTYDKVIIYIIYINYTCQKKRFILFLTYSKKKGGLQNPSKRFCRFLKASKCVQSFKKRIKNSTEPFEGSPFYSLAEPSLTKPFFRFRTTKKGFVEKYKTLRVQYKTINLWYETIMVSD
jgi:hypothetical protein